jgi:hypothetical protein
MGALSMSLRMTVKRWMILVVIISLFLCCLLMKLRSDYFRERAIEYARQEAACATTAAQLEALAKGLAKMPDPLPVRPGDTNLEHAINYATEAAKWRTDERSSGELKRLFQRAATRPWEFAPPAEEKAVGAGPSH